jgi:hypothetical protein
MPLEDIRVTRIDIVRILENGMAVRYERSTTRPYEEAGAIPMAGHGDDVPLWLRPEGTGAPELPALPPIYGALPPE